MTQFLSRGIFLKVFYILMFSSIYLTSAEIAIKTNNSDAMPLTIAVSQVGWFANGYSWYLSINSAGKAVLTLNAPSMMIDEFEIENEELKELRKIIYEQKFFKLNDNYGEDIADASETKISIIIGDQSKTVSIKYLMNWVNDNPKKVVEPAKALRVLHKIRSWIKNPEAVDLRDYETVVIKAADAVKSAK